MSDDVVAAARAGEAEAWAQLYRRCAGGLLSWLRTRPCADAAVTADDVAAEAWLVAASRIADFEGDDDQFVGWLFGIARNIQGGTHRRAVRRATFPAEDDVLAGHVGAEPDPTLVLSERQWVREAIASLPPRERDAVGLVDGVGLTHAAAATALDVSPVTLRVARHRGLRRLRRVLGASEQAQQRGEKSGAEDDDQERGAQHQ